VDSERKMQTPKYNRAGGLEQVKLDGTTYVKHIAYNAKGQRTLIAFGNGVMTRYAHDPVTFRLTRLRSERYTMPNGLSYHPTGQALQDFGYVYDLAGNILKITDRTPGSGIQNTLSGTDALDRVFSYDPLYRLLAATGRECDTSLAAKPWADAPKCQDVTLTRAYKEAYAYDAVGNMTRLGHTDGAGGFVRDYALVPGTNRLLSMTVGGSSYAYKHDVNGNMVRENSSRNFEWDHNDRMRVFRNQVSGSGPSVHAQYLYDADGQRVKKLVRKQNGGVVEVGIYIDGMFEHHWQTSHGVTKENNTLHVMDDERRIAMVRVGNALETSDSSAAVQYQLGDHLGSSSVVVNANGTWINREEFTPYGETSFGRHAGKRYRFTGMERDEESSFNYHGARYYSSWLARWTSCDPHFMLTDSSNRQYGIAIYVMDKLNPYPYANNNPIVFRDLTGKEGEGLPDDNPQIIKTNLKVDPQKRKQQTQLIRTTLYLVPPKILPPKVKLMHKATKAMYSTLYSRQKGKSMSQATARATGEVGYSALMWKTAGKGAYPMEIGGALAEVALTERERKDLRLAAKHPAKLILAILWQAKEGAKLTAEVFAYLAGFSEDPESIAKARAIAKLREKWKPIYERNIIKQIASGRIDIREPRHRHYLHHPSPKIRRYARLSISGAL
jgi:RHS repeat-associated protein